MPFEISPEFKPTIEPMRVGHFQDVADAIQRGCGIHHKQAFCQLYDPSEKASCVMGAAFIGLGLDVTDPAAVGDQRHWSSAIGRRLDLLMDAYKAAYGHLPQFDNNSRRFTREQIAARIAAL